MGPPADIEKETADVNRKVAVLLSRFSIELRDPTTYEEALAPLLKRLGQPLGTSAFGFASAYKEAGNALFKQGQHAWALHTYLVGTSLLERLGRSSAADAKVVEAEDDPELRPVFLASCAEREREPHSHDTIARVVRFARSVCHTPMSTRPSGTRTRR